MGKFYITTTLPYVNAEPHIGFAMEIVRADVLARMHRIIGDEVFFNTGTDEHGQKIYQKAVAAGIDPQKYCDEYAAKFESLKKGMNLSYDNFIRTTDEHHTKAAQDFWTRCFENGDIYKKTYEVKYCVGCELEKTDSELNVCVKAAGPGGMTIKETQRAQAKPSASTTRRSRARLQRRGPQREHRPPPLPRMQTLPTLSPFFFFLRS